MRIFTHSDPRGLPHWDDLTKFFTVGSTHIGAVTRFMETGVIGTIELDKNEIPFFVDMASLKRECRLPDVGDVLTVRVVSLNEARREIKFTVDP